MVFENLLKHKRYLLFCIGGVSVWTFEMLMTVILTEIFNITSYHSFALSLTIGSNLLFFYYAVIVFESYPISLNKYFRFFMLYFVTCSVVWLISFALIKYTILHYLPAMVLASSVSSFANYSVNNRIVFKK